MRAVRRRRFALAAAVVFAVTVSPVSAAVAAVPPATDANAVITVKVGGDRLTTASVGGLAGITLQLWDGTDTGPTAPVPSDQIGGTNTCVSDADGDCSWIIPNTGSDLADSANRDRRFWIVQAGGVPAPWFQNTSLITGPDGGPFSATPYRFRTGTELRSGTTYSSGSNFMVGTGNTAPTASGGIWQSSRVNPVVPTECGLRVALVLDLSGSVSGSLPALKNAATTFTNSLVGTPSQLALFTFAATAPAPGANNANRPLTPVSTQAGADTVNAWINGLSAGGTTNWDRGLFQVAQSASNFDIVVVVTDGNPTVYGNSEGPGNYTRLREVENGIFSANAIKSENTRILAIGVGAGISAGAANLAAISGPTANSDYFQTTNYSQVGGVLRALALGSCTGSVTVVKQVVPSTAPDGSIAGAVPVGGWQFAASTTTSGVTIAPASGVTAVGTGALNFNLTFPGGINAASVAVTETQQAGYSLIQVGGFNAVCTRLDTGASMAVANAGAFGFTVEANFLYPVTCTVYNRAPAPPAQIVVNKQWAITDTTSGVTTTYVDGTQPGDLQASLSLNGSAQPFGAVRADFRAGDEVAIAETVTNGLRGCTIGTPTLARASEPGNLGVPYTATLGEGSNAFVLTNPVTCTTRLTLVKNVSSGPALPNAWSLSATAPAGAAAGPAGTTGVSALVTPGARYTLAESGGDPRYTQRAGANAVPIPGSTISWQCVEIDANGSVIPGFADGLNGGVIVFMGLSVRCSAVNDTAQLTLVKHVVGDPDGTVDASAWLLTATPIASPTIPPGLVAQTVTGSETGNSMWVRPGQSYVLSESGPGGFVASAWTCEGGTFDPATGVVVAPAGEGVSCEITNTALQRATVVKDFVDAIPTPGTGIVTVRYKLTVTNPNASDSVLYDLTDATGFPPGVTVNAVEVTGPSGATVNPSFDGITDQVITTGRELAPEASESYMIVVTADVPATVAPDLAMCEDDPGHGFYNVGAVASFGLTSTDAACGDIPVPPTPSPSPTPGPNPLAATGGTAPYGAVVLGIFLLVGGGALTFGRRRAKRG